MGRRAVAVTPPGKRAIPKRPDPERIRNLNALADLHATFADANVDNADFHPKEHPKKRSDYNQHNVDLDGDPIALADFHAQAAEIFKGGAAKEA